MSNILNTNTINEIITVKDEDAIQVSRLLARKEGVFCGISSGAAVWTSLKIAEKQENKDKTMVAILPDTGEWYPTTELFMER